GVRDSAAGLLLITLVEIAVYGEVVLCRGLRVQAKAAALLMPGIERRRAVREHVLFVVEIFAVHPEVRGRADLPPVSTLADGLELRAAAGIHVGSLRILRALGDDIDHAVDGIGSPKRAAWTADD